MYGTLIRSPKEGWNVRKIGSCGTDQAFNEGARAGNAVRRTNCQSLNQLSEASIDSVHAASSGGRTVTCGKHEMFEQASSAGVETLNCFPKDV